MITYSETNSCAQHDEILHLDSNLNDKYGLMPCFSYSIYISDVKYIKNSWKKHLKNHFLLVGH